jgi:hypothetical protein
MKFHVTPSSGSRVVQCGLLSGFQPQALCLRRYFSFQAPDQAADCAPAVICLYKQLTKLLHKHAQTPVKTPRTRSQCTKGNNSLRQQPPVSLYTRQVSHSLAARRCGVAFALKLRADKSGFNVYSNCRQ